MAVYCCRSYCFNWILKQAERELEFEKFEFPNFSNLNSLNRWVFAKNAILRVLRRSRDFQCWQRGDGDCEDVSPCSRNTLHHFWKIFTFLTNSFDAFRLRDMDLAAMLLHCAYELLLDKGTVEVNMSWVAFQNSSKKLTENDFKLLMKVTYTNEEVRSTLTRVVWTMVRKRKQFFLHNLLRYGVMYLPPRNSRRTRNKFIAAVQYLIFDNDYGYIDLLTAAITNSMMNRHGRHVLRAVELLALEMKSRQARANREIVRGDHSRFHEIFFDPESPRFRCLRMVFDSIPEPFVTSQEVRQIIELAHTNQRRIQPAECSCLEKFIDELMSIFKMMYPESEGPITPRSLKHLSRCQVRDSLRQTGALPHGIHELNLPRYIKKYVLLEN